MLGRFLPLACIFLFHKHLHSPLCAYLKNRNLLRNSLRLASADAKPRAIKFT